MKLEISMVNKRQECSQGELEVTYNIFILEEKIVMYIA